MVISHTAAFLNINCHLLLTYLSLNSPINHWLWQSPLQQVSTTISYMWSVSLKRNVLRRIINVLTEEAVRQFSGREFQSLGAATEERRAAVSKLCGGTDRNFCVDDLNINCHLLLTYLSLNPPIHRWHCQSPLQQVSTTVLPVIKSTSVSYMWSVGLHYSNTTLDSYKSIKTRENNITTAHFTRVAWHLCVKVQQVPHSILCVPNNNVTCSVKIHSSIATGWGGGGAQGARPPPYRRQAWPQDSCKSEIFWGEGVGVVTALPQTS